MCFRIHVLPLYTSAKRKHMKKKIDKYFKKNNQESETKSI